MPKSRPLTDAQGEVRELQQADLTTFKPASEALPLSLQRELGVRGPQKAPTTRSVSPSACLPTSSGVSRRPGPGGRRASTWRCRIGWKSTTLRRMSADEAVREPMAGRRSNCSRFVRPTKRLIPARTEASSVAFRTMKSPACLDAPSTTFSEYPKKQSVGLNPHS